MNENTAVPFVVLCVISIPVWLRRRIRNLFQDNPHFESSYYGPLGTRLSCYFPATEGFLIKPQCRLRSPPADGTHRTSLDSMGDVCGTSNKDEFPDFVVCKGTASRTGDIPFLIYEIKRDAQEYSEAHAQMYDYIQWAQAKQNNTSTPVTIWAILVFGSLCDIFELNPGDAIIQQKIGLDTIGKPIDKILQDLHSMHHTPATYAANTFPPWLHERLISLITDGTVHYETSYYVPIYMLLTWYFPAKKNFLVKPQARLRTPDGPGRSVDSYGRIVSSTPDHDNPDFLVSKSEEGLYNDVPFLIYEIKRNGDSPGDAARQLDRYVQWARSYQSSTRPDVTIHAVLVMGDTCEVHTLPENTGIDLVFTRTYKFGGKEFFEQLDTLKRIWTGS